MKKFLLIVLAVTLSLGVFAQFQKLNFAQRTTTKNITEAPKSLSLDLNKNIKKVNKDKKNTNNVNEQVFGTNDIMMFSSYDTSSASFYYSNMFSIAMDSFSNYSGFNAGYIEKYYSSTPVSILSGAVYLYAEKVLHPNDSIYFIIYDKEFNPVDGMVKRYSDCKMNNTSKYPNYGTGVTKFDFPQPVVVSDTFYLAVVFNNFNPVSAVTGDSIFVYSSKHDVRKLDYPNQNYVINYYDGNLYIDDIQTIFEIRTNLWIGAVVENPACANFTVDAGSDLTVCSGDSVLLKATFTGNYTNPIFAWSDSLVDHDYIIGNNIKGVVTSSKKLYITLISDNVTGECMAYDSLYITVKTDCNPNVCDLTASITKTVNTTTVTLDALPNIGATYNWNTGATTQNITVNKPTINTTYYVTVTKIGTTCTATAAMVVLANDNGACNISASISKTVNNDKSVTLTAFPSLDATYLWSTNATTQSITINPTTTATTNYTVTVTKIGTTCTSIASTSITSLNEIEQIKASLSVYPMPINEQLNISFDMINSENVNIIISDITGRIIYNETIKNNGTSVNKNINTENIANGVYTLKIETLNGNIVKKIIKN